MTILSLVQKTARSVGLDVPSAVIGNTDRNVVQLLALANEEGEDLAARSKWSVMAQYATFTQKAAASQGTLDDDGSTGLLSSDDFDYIINDTMWNRTTSLPILGPLNEVDWETLQAFPVTGPYQQYDLRGKELFFDPVGANATDTIAFVYQSTSWCESSGGTGQSEWTADTDIGRLDERLMRLGLIWRWKKQKGLEYAEDFKTYERRVMDGLARDGGATRLQLAGGIRHRLPGIMLPLGSWALT